MHHASQQRQLNGIVKDLRSSFAISICKLLYVRTYLVLFWEAAILPGVVLYESLPGVLFDFWVFIRTTTTTIDTTTNCTRTRRERKREKTEKFSLEQEANGRTKAVLPVVVLQWVSVTPVPYLEPPGNCMERIVLYARSAYYWGRHIMYQWPM